MPLGIKDSLGKTGKGSQMPTDPKEFLTALPTICETICNPGELVARFDEIRTHIAHNIKTDPNTSEKGMLHGAFYEAYIKRIEFLVSDSGEDEQDIFKKEFGRVIVKSAQAGHILSTEVRSKIAKIGLDADSYDEMRIKRAERVEESRCESCTKAELAAVECSGINANGDFGLKERLYWEKRVNHALENGSTNKVQKVLKLSAIWIAIQRASYNSGKNLDHVLTFIEEAIEAKGGKLPTQIEPPPEPVQEPTKEPTQESELSQIPSSLRGIPRIDVFWPKITKTIKSRQYVEDLMSFFNRWQTAVTEKWGVPEDKLETFFNWIIHCMEERATEIGESFSVSNPFSNPTSRKRIDSVDHSEVGYIKRLFAKCTPKEQLIIQKLLTNRVDKLTKDETYLVLSKAVKNLDPDMEDLSKLVVAIYAATSPFMEVLKKIIEDGKKNIAREAIK